MIATLPMYDIAEAAAHTEALWRAVAATLREMGMSEVPAALSQDLGTHALLAPNLLLGQTCGYPLTHALAGRVRYVATPCYRARGCAGGFYRSAFVVREDHPARSLADCRGDVFAVNGFDSQSGWNAPRLAAARLAPCEIFFASLLETGAHYESLAAVAAGRAGLCAVDGISLALLRRHRPQAFEGLRILAWTQPAPGLPLVTRADASDRLVRALRAALRRALQTPALATSLDALLLDGIEVLGVEVYQRVIDMETEALALGGVHR